jgi:hypothetical protein
MSEMSDFQKQFMAKGVGNTLFTQKEFDDALAMAQAEIMAMAIEASKTAVLMEREACAKIAEAYGNSASDHEAGASLNIAEDIRNRIPSQRN